MKQIKLDLIGMSCASCANSIDKVLNKLEGVKNAAVNLANDTAIIDYDENIVTIEQIIDAVEAIGYDAKINENKVTQLTMRIEGMTCASCAQNVDRAVRKLDGVIEVFVNIANDKMTLSFDHTKIKLSQIKKAVYDAGYDAYLFEASNDEIDPDVIKMQKARKKVLISMSITVVMMLLMIIQMTTSIDIPFYTLLVAIMGFPVVFILGYAVHKGSFKSLKSGHPNMDVLVSLGSMPPYLIGLLGLFLPIQTFIEMATTIMTFHLLGKYLEARAKGKASLAIKKLIELGSKTASILVDGQEIEVLTSELSVGDIMLIKPGEKIPSDGIIIEGETVIDESLATGESMPVKRAKGDMVIGATINKQGLLKVEVLKVGDHTFLAQVIHLVEACQGSKVPIQAFADKVTGYFVPAIMIITALTFTSFMVFPSFHLAILNTFDFLPWINTELSQLTLAFITATSVLVIACPCALGLGTPTALMVGSGIGAEQGILIRQGEAVQTLKDVKAIAFDKTGTLTIGKPVVTDLISKDEKEMLQIVASLEQGSEHPLAQAMILKAKEDHLEILDIENFTAVAGMGILGEIHKEIIHIGNRKFMDSEHIDYKTYEIQMTNLENQAKTVMIVSKNKTALGIIAVADQVKPEAKKVIEILNTLNLKTIMITGDNERTAKAIAKQIGLTDYISDVLPQGKVDAIKSLQTTYGLVSMVGDGINDAPALKQANVGIALGTGTDVAIEAADMTLVNGQLETILKAITLSDAMFKKIKQNYFWAWFYNALMIPFAMFGLLHPMIGAAAMSLSSLNVIYNSLRLKKVNLNKYWEANHEA
jgi:Cu+-exporting ATPase